MTNFAAEVTREVSLQKCRAVDANEIVVCARRQPDERYRMPDRDRPFDPSGDTSSVTLKENAGQREAKREPSLADRLGQAVGQAV